MKDTTPFVHAGRPDLHHSNAARSLRQLLPTRCMPARGQGRCWYRRPGAETVGGTMRCALVGFVVRGTWVAAL